MQFDLMAHVWLEFIDRMKLAKLNIEKPPVRVSFPD